MKKKTKVLMVKIIKNILRAISVLSFVLMIGVIGGVDNGEPLTNMLWTIPLFALSIFTGCLGF